MSVADEPRLLTVEAAEQIRELIIGQVLLPGEKIRQADIADRIGVSRSPLREALRTLASEGLVTYESNRGYVVSRLSADELAQIYRMRQLLETDLLSSVRKPQPEEVAAINEFNERLIRAQQVNDLAGILNANREFHFAIFRLSPLDRIFAEVHRLWTLSEGYRATYLMMPETRSRIVKEHTQIVAAVRKPDHKRLIELSDAHRAASEEIVVLMLSRSARR